MPWLITLWWEWRSWRGKPDKPDDAQLYASRAEKLRSVYFDTFYNPATGVLAGWKSADGKLHDYYFTVRQRRRHRLWLWFLATRPTPSWIACWPR